MSEASNWTPWRGQLLMQLRRELRGLDAASPPGWRLSTAMSAVLGATGAAVVIGHEGLHRKVLGASDAVVVDLLDVEEVLGQGPGMTATATRTPTTCHNGGDGDPRWPGFGHEARERLGDVWIHAVSVRTPEDSPTGVAYLYGRPPQALVSPDHVDFVAQMVTTALSGDQLSPHPPPPEPWLSRAVVHQATGMVMGQAGVGVDNAVALLRAHAFATSSSMASVATEVVDRTLNFS